MTPRRWPSIVLESRGWERRLPQVADTHSKLTEHALVDKSGSGAVSGAASPCQCGIKCTALGRCSQARPSFSKVLAAFKAAVPLCSFDPAVKHLLHDGLFAALHLLRERFDIDADDQSAHLIVDPCTWPRVGDTTMHSCVCPCSVAARRKHVT